ncbi:MAG: hypothetical protein ACXADO_09495 [Candidatus Thorarchaeota archaeon]|jgi:hypothetical protein
MSKEGVTSPINIKLESMMELARMLVSSSQRDRPASMLYFEYNGRHIYGTLISHHGYWLNYGMPLWVYAEGDGPPEGSFLSYTSRDKEDIRFVKTLEAEPRVAYLPIIKLAEKLEILNL